MECEINEKSSADAAAVPGRMRKLEKKWTAEDDRTMIEMIEKRDIIWNSRSPMYKNRDMKSKSWIEISEKTKHSVLDAKNRWNIIKSRYNSERNKVITRNVGKDGKIYQSKYELYMSLQFLSKAPSKSGGGPVINLQSQSSATNEGNKSQETIKDEQIGIPNASSSSPSKKKIKNQHLSATILEQDLSAAINKSFQQYRNEEDEYDAFGRYLALGLRTLPPRLAIECQNELQSTLTNYRLMYVPQQPIIRADSLSAHSLSPSSNSGHSYKPPETCSSNHIYLQENRQSAVLPSATIEIVKCESEDFNGF